LAAVPRILVTRPVKKAICFVALGSLRSTYWKEYACARDPARASPLDLFDRPRRELFEAQLFEDGLEEEVNG
jgi:hypothetical protein